MNTNMTCSDCRESLPWYVTDRIDPAVREHIDRHLITCAQCRQELLDWREISGAAHYSRELVQPPSLTRMSLWNTLQASIDNNAAMPDTSQNVASRTDPGVTDLGILAPIQQHSDLQRRMPIRRRIAAALMPLAAAILLVSLIGYFHSIGDQLSISTEQRFVTVYAGMNANDREYLQAIRPDGSLAWKTALFPHLSQPIASGSVVIVTSQTSLLPQPDRPAYVLAFDARTGAQRWKYQAPSPVLAKVDDHGHVIVSSVESNFTNGLLTSLDIASGRVVWTVLLTLPARNIEVDAATILATTTDLGCSDTCPHTTMVAIDVVTGHQLWTYNLPTESQIFTTVKTDGDRLLLFYSMKQQGNAAAILAAFDFQSGVLQWSQSFGNTVGASVPEGITASHASVFITVSVPGSMTETAIYAMQLTSGQSIWHATLPGIQTGLFFTSNALVLGILNDARYETTIFSATNGAVQWNSPTTSQTLPLLSDNGVIYTREIDAQGTISHSTASNASRWSIVARMLPKGQPLWRVYLADQPAQMQIKGATLTVVAGPLIGGDAYQGIAILNRKNGSVLWQITIPNGYLSIG